MLVWTAARPALLAQISETWQACYITAAAAAVRLWQGKNDKASKVEDEDAEEKQDDMK
jgi:hypothetical protein